MNMRSLLASREEYSDLVERAAAAHEPGVTPINGLQERHAAKVAGVVRSVVLEPRDKHAALVAELYDGTGTVVLLWQGRRAIHGIEPGRRLCAQGMVTRIDGRLGIFNPRYELRPKAGE